MAAEQKETSQPENLSRFAASPTRPVIIGGCPRSGTTLLRSMLHAHPEHAVPARETRFVLESWARRTRFGDQRKQRNRRRLARWIFLGKERHAERLGLDPEEAMGRLIGAPPTLGSLLAECFAMFAEQHGKPRWGDKRPLYAVWIATIFALFPSAQFIHVVRDPRACAASLRRLKWYGGDIVPSLEYWEASLLAVDAMRPELAADQLLEVRYEDLVLEPAEALARVAGFLGSAADEDTVDQMLRYHELGEKRRGPYHRNLKRPLDASRVSGWSESLSKPEIAFIEEATLPLMDRWDYEPSSEGTPSPSELFDRLRVRRRQRARARKRLIWLDRLQTYVTDRHPIAAQSGEAEDVGG